MSELNIELLGNKIQASSISGLLALVSSIGIICAFLFYTISYNPDGITKVVSAFGGMSQERTELSKNNFRDSLEFFIPTSPEYESGQESFENWLSANNEWWGKTPMTNILKVNGEKQVIKGFMYSAENPFDGSPLTVNAVKEIQNQAITNLGVSNLDTIWVEIVTQRVH